MTSPEEKLKDTGNHPHSERIESVQFDRYTIKVRLGNSDEFLGIVEVAVDQDFRSLKQRIESTGTHDVSDFYDIES